MFHCARRTWHATQVLQNCRHAGHSNRCIGPMQKNGTRISACCKDSASCTSLSGHPVRCRRRNIIWRKTKNTTPLGVGSPSDPNHCRSHFGSSPFVLPTVLWKAGGNFEHFTSCDLARVPTKNVLHARFLKQIFNVHGFQKKSQNVVTLQSHKKGPGHKQITEIQRSPQK